MLTSEHNIDTSNIREEVSYHHEESIYHFDQFLKSRKEAQDHLIKFQEHQISHLRLSNILNRGRHEI